MTPSDILLQAFYQMKERAALVTNKAIHQNYRPLGICSQMDDLVALVEAPWGDKHAAKTLFHEILSGQATDWPRHSGCTVYPVPYTDTEWLKKKWESLSFGQQQMYSEACDDFDDDDIEAGIPFENCPQSGLAEMTFDKIEPRYFWDANHPYGKARLEFLDFLINVVKHHV